MKISFFKILFSLGIVMLTHYGSDAQINPDATILFEEDWEEVMPNTIPTGWSGDIDEAMILDTAWVVGIGPSSPANTGPNAANTGAQYLYFESSAPAGPGATAELLSPVVAVNGDNIVLSFALYMFGVDIERLDVSVESGGTTTLLNRYDTQLQSSKSEPWSIQTLDLSAYDGQSIQISFDAQKRILDEGDIAIDSILIYSQPDPVVIPTLGQWSVLNLGLVLLIIASTALRQRQYYLKGL